MGSSTTRSCGCCTRQAGSPNGIDLRYAAASFLIFSLSWLRDGKTVLFAPLSVWPQGAGFHSEERPTESRHEGGVRRINANLGLAAGLRAAQHSRAAEAAKGVGRERDLDIANPDGEKRR